MALSTSEIWNGPAGSEDERRVTSRSLLALEAEANWTVPSHASLFVGLLPNQHGTVGFAERLGQSFLTLAEILREHGYETVGLNENPWVGEPSRGLTQGFDRFATIENYFTEDA